MAHTAKKKHSPLYDRFCKCVDSEFIDWEKTNLSKSEKRTIEEYEAWGILHAALYILDFDDYHALIDYVWEKHGYDYTGAHSGEILEDQMSLKEYMARQEEKHERANDNQ